MAKTKEYYRDDRYLKKFGANLRRIRIEKGLSQEDLADLSMSQAYLSTIKAGAVNLTLSHVAALAKRLNVAVSELVDV